MNFSRKDNRSDSIDDGRFKQIVFDCAVDLSHENGELSKKMIGEKLLDALRRHNRGVDLTSDEHELIINKLANIRDELFDKSDNTFDGHDMIPAYVSDPYEVLLGIERKIIRQKREVEDVERKIAEQGERISALNASLNEGWLTGIKRRILDLLGY